MALRPTPYSISLCALIALNVEKYDKQVDQFLEIIFQDPVWSDPHAPSIASLLHQYRAQFGDDHTATYKQWLKAAVSSVDSLVDLMESLKYTNLHKHSLYGSYVQKVGLGFDQLAFEDVLQLFHDFSDQIQGKEVDDQWNICDNEMETQVREQCFRINESSPLGEEHRYHQWQHDLDALLAHNPELYSGYFMEFLIQICKGERAGSINSLFRYMDFGLQKHDSLQFGSILLASLFEAFGDTKLVSAAIEEAICISQQSSDQHSVIYALGKLGEGTANKDYLTNCVNRARDNQLPHLVAGASLTLAELYSSWSDLENAVCEPAKTTEILDDRPVRVRNIEQATALHLITRHLLVAASIWEYYGETSLSLETCRSALQNHAHLSTSDIRICIQNIARFSLNSPKSTSPESCIYQGAVETYQDLTDRYVGATAVDNGLDLFLALIVLEWTVRRGEMRNAEDLLSAIESHMYPRLDNYKSILIDVASLKAFLLSRQRRWEEATCILNSKIELLRDDDFSSAKSQRGRLLLQLATTHLESSKNTRFSSVLPPLMECLTLSESEKMHGLHASATSILAQVHLRQGNVTRSIKALRAVMPSLIRSEQVWTQAEAYLTLAKCHMKRHRESNSPRAMLSAERDLQRCKDLFLKTHDLLRLQEVYYLLARVYDVLGNKRSREDASQDFATTSHALRLNCSKQTGIVTALSCRAGIVRLVSDRISS